MEQFHILLSSSTHNRLDDNNSLNNDTSYSRDYSLQLQKESAFQYMDIRMIQRVHWVQYDRIRENNITVNEADYDIIAEAVKIRINLLGMKNPIFQTNRYGFRGSFATVGHAIFSLSCRVF
jgi:hypothetical protein